MDLLSQLLIDLLLTFITLFPLGQFFILGWDRRAGEISTALTSKAKCFYLVMFQNQDCTVEHAKAKFDEMYKDWYGRRFYVIPILLVFLVSVYENFYLANAIKTLLVIDASHQKDVFTISIAAVAGAYTFVTWDFFLRMQRRNLAIIDVLGGALRMVMALPIGYAAALIEASHGAALAFVIAAFPVQGLTTIARRLANKWLKLEIGADTSLHQVKTLAGVDAAIADRISNADITTITQLAWCDPIQLTMRTNLQFAFILDIVSQALAWVYLEKRLERLRPLGLRGAVEIRNLMNGLKSKNEQKKKKAYAVLPAAAMAAAALEARVKPGERPSAPQKPTEELSIAGIRHAFEEIAYDPATIFLHEAWAETALVARMLKSESGAVELDAVADEESDVEEILDETKSSSVQQDERIAPADMAGIGDQHKPGPRQSRGRRHTRRDT